MRRCIADSRAIRPDLLGEWDRHSAGKLCHDAPQAQDLLLHYQQCSSTASALLSEVKYEDPRCTLRPVG